MKTTISNQERDRSKGYSSNSGRLEKADFRNIIQKMMVGRILPGRLTLEATRNKTRQEMKEMKENGNQRKDNSKNLAG